MPSDSVANQMVDNANRAAAQLAQAPTAAKNAALLAMAHRLEEGRQEIVEANQADMADARAAGIPSAQVVRLAFDGPKVDSRVQSLQTIAALPDPVGQLTDVQRTDLGLLVGRMRVPLGVILMIYEARPHVTVNAGAFALKAGNAIICKGGSDAARCNDILGGMWADSLAEAGLDRAAVQVAAMSHDQVEELLDMEGRIQLVIPRGGKKLIQAVSARSRIPVIKHFEGVCHVYWGPGADETKAVEIALDSKLLMPGVCNAAETLLVDASLEERLPRMLKALQDAGIELRGCARSQAALPGIAAASEEDWYAEYLDKVYAVRVVEGLDQAMEHIATYGSGHTESIVSEDYTATQRFLRQVDSGVVLVNASTMFCDGQSLGMGAEIGISTDRLHARGPMGLRELTTYKFAIQGSGQVMGTPQEWGTA